MLMLPTSSFTPYVVTQHVSLLQTPGKLHVIERKAAELVPGTKKQEGKKPHATPCTDKRKGEKTWRSVGLGL